MSAIPNNGDGYAGFLQPADTTTAYNSQTFLIWAILSKIHTATLVKVVAVTNSGDVSPVGFVDVLPLINQMDGAWNAVPHAVVYKCPYFRLQGGGDAIIIDPKIGDVGIAIFADRDISAATANIIAKQGQVDADLQSAPGSRRKFDMADGLYIGGVLNGAPTQYVEFSAAGIKMHSPTAIQLDAPSIAITCQTFTLNATSSVTIATPTLTVHGDVATTGTVKNNGVNIGSTHSHTDPQGGTIGPPF